MRSCFDLYKIMSCRLRKVWTPATDFLVLRALISTISPKGSQIGDASFSFLLKSSSVYFLFEDLVQVNWNTEAVMCVVLQPLGWLYTVALEDPRFIQIPWFQSFEWLVACVNIFPEILIWQNDSDSKGSVSVLRIWTILPGSGSAY
jgi:hypothetical protein